jgi:hypothetical protein
MKTKRTIPPCPPNGLPRAAWFRDFAVRVEDADPTLAASCRATAARIESGVFDGLPLIQRMEG